jgi:hypothetical protein
VDGAVWGGDDAEDIGFGLGVICLNSMLLRLGRRLGVMLRLIRSLKSIE